MINKNIIKLKNILSEESINKICLWSKENRNLIDLINFLIKEFNIDCSADRQIIQSYDRDWSNMKGKADALSRPINELECATILFVCQKIKIPITISAGRTNLNGSATPMGGMVLSTEKLTTPNIIVNQANKTVTTPVGIFLEEMRIEVKKQTNNRLHYPVDPTSRKEAMIGGTISCNASGFVPGITGATRYWTQSIDFITLQGYKISCDRGQYISNNSKFILDFGKSNGKKILEIPSYSRPQIKNASGPYSDINGKLDFVDLIVGSEGIFGLVTSVTLGLKDTPETYLDLFFNLPTEKDAVDFHNYIYNYYNGDLSNITALEYFGYNCRTYMKNWEHLFNSKDEVGIYLQVPLYNEKLENVADKWLSFLMDSNCGIKEDGILLLNEPRNWNIFFEARHSIPVNALEKTQRLGTWSILTDTIVPHKNFPKFLNLTHSLLQKSKIEYLLFGHLGDCHLHFHLIPTKKQQVKALDIYEKIILISAELGGVYSAEHGTGKRKRSDFLQCYGSEAVKCVEKTKMVFDPDFLLNRGNVINYVNK